MEKRSLGKSDLAVAPLAFGGNVFGWTIDEATSFQLLDAFTDAGFNLIDTADVYAKWAPGNKGGESETIIGKWLQRTGKRKAVIIATKVGAEMASDKKGLSKSYMLKAVEDSLRRLHTDYIDLYQSHYDDTDTRVEETLETYELLIKSGKVRIIGASNYTGERLSEALQAGKKGSLPRYQTLQPLYNLYDREKYEKEFAGIVDQYDLGVLPYYSLASGFLTGKYRSEDDLSKSQRGGGIKKYLNERGFRILKALDAVAEAHQNGVAQVSIAWLIAQPHVTAAIASATSLKQLSALTDAVNLILDAGAIQSLNEASAY
ncbi:MAG: aldo/keto reductase [Sphingobacteriaceae bacterium]